MEVSRDYINYTEIQEFPVAERFLKLPIENFLAIEQVEPIEPQIAIINAINDPRHRFIVACLSRRTGKTYIANHIGFLKAMEPNTAILIVSPNYSLTGISWNEQKAILAKHGVEVVSSNKTEKEIHLENGSMLKFGSAANANSLVGRSYDLIIFDESALDSTADQSFNIQLRPTLDKVNSKCIFISTPRGTNWFYDFYQRGFLDSFPTWVSIHSTWKDNPRNSEEDIKEARLGMSSAEFKQEYEAEFTVFLGQIFEGFDAELCVRDLSDMDFKSNPYRFEGIMGIDPGYRDATGAVALQYDSDMDVFYCVWDYENAERTTDKHAEAFNEAYEKHDIDIVFTDSAAAQFIQDMAVLYDLPSNKANKSVLDGIAYVQGLVDNNKLIVDEKCLHLIHMMNNYRWDPNDALIKPKPKHDHFSHVADALRYALYSYVH